MEVTVKWFDGKYPSFNVGIASKAGNEPFLEVKGCRIVEGKNGQFVSPPSTKNESSGKYWNHAYFSEDFARVVLEKALDSKPKEQAKSRPTSNATDDFESDIPF